MFSEVVPEQLRAGAPLQPVPAAADMLIASREASLMGDGAKERKPGGMGLFIARSYIIDVQPTPKPCPKTIRDGPKACLSQSNAPLRGYD